MIRHLNSVLSNVSVARKAIEKGLECVVRRPVNELPVELQTAVDILHEVDKILTRWEQNGPYEKEIHSAT